MPKEAIAGFNTYWDQFGKSDRKGLLLHCTMGSMAAWRGMIEHIGPKYSWTAFDMPGHGKSDDWSFDRDFHRTGTEIGKALMGGEPMDVVGHSFGGSIALRLALEMPELVKSLTLIEPVVLSIIFQDDPHYQQKYDQDHRGYRDGIDAKDYEKAAREFAVHWGDDVPWDDVPDKYKDMMIDKIIMIEQGEPVVYHDTYGFSQKGRLSAIKCPVLLVQGTTSHDSVGRVNDALERRIEHTERVHIAGAGHMVPLSHPVEMAQVLDKFLTKNMTA